MAERYDPKVPVRPPSEQKGPPESGAEEDPLVELARIVSGRATFDGGPGARNKTVPASGGVTGSPADFARDLESELLNDLQASFVAIREPLAAAPPPPPAPTPAPQAVQASAPPRQEPPASTPRPALPVVSRSERTTPALRTERLAQSLTRRSDPAPEPKERHANSTGAVQSEPERPSLFRPNRAERNAAGRSLQLRTGTPANPPAPDLQDESRRVVSSRWDHPEPDEDRERETLASRFAPPQAREEEGDFPPLEDEAFPDEAPFDEVPEEEFALEDLATMPAFADDDQLPPFPGEDDFEPLRPRRSYRGVLALGAVLAVVLVGGAAAWMYGPGGGASGPPRIIAADASPTKVAPEEPDTGAEGDSKNKLIYDRVDGSDASKDTTLLTPEVGDIADLPASSDTDPNNPISRVIVPGGPGVDGPLAETGETPPAADGNASAPAADVSNPIGPRKVRTVVVRPDGTIVSSEAAPEADAGSPGANAASGAAPNAAEPPTASTNPADRVLGSETDMDKVLSGDENIQLPVDSDPLGVGGTSAGSEPATATASNEPAGTVPAAEDAPATAAPAPSAPEPLPTEPSEAAAPPPADTQPAPKPAKAAAPKPAKPAASTKVAAATGGGWLVQVSSQKSEDAAQAAYRGLQGKYRSILGPFQPNIARVDLGSKGVYYRVRVGPFSNNDAQRLCSDLKAAGGDCLLAH